MKFRYFLRGLGVGIIFTTIVCAVAYKSNNYVQLNEDTIVKEAEALGMVRSDDKIQELIAEETSTEKQTTEKTTTEKATKDTSKDKITTEKTTKDTSKDKKTTEKTTKDSSKDKKTTEKTTKDSSKDKKTTEKATTEKSNKENSTKKENKDENKQITLTIPSGSSSYPVCQDLKKLGLIEDAEAYDDYLIEHGYANRLSVGTHSLKKGMSLEEIAIAISDPLEEDKEK